MQWEQSSFSTTRIKCAALHVGRRTERGAQREKSSISFCTLAVLYSSIAHRQPSNFHARNGLSVAFVLAKRAQSERHLAVKRAPGRPFCEPARPRSKEGGVCPKRQNSRI